MRRQFLPALGMLFAFSVLTGAVYPLAVTGIAQIAFREKADGSLLERNGRVIGSRLIGQPFIGDGYFHPRPSATSYAPGPASAYGSNEGPTSERFLYGENDPATDTDESRTSGVDDRVRAYRTDNGLPKTTPVPVDAVTGSGSSLDPHISVANARLQASRVAGVRRLRLRTVLRLIEQHTDERALGFLGEPGVNVLSLNLALDELE